MPNGRKRSTRPKRSWQPPTWPNAGSIRVSTDQLFGLSRPALRDGLGERAGALHHAALNIAAALNAYLLCDRGSWLNFKNRGALAVLVEGDRRLFNQYGVMLVNSARHPHVKQNEGQAFIDWLVSPAGQRTIAAYRIGGAQVFFPNAVQ
jgi:tungstate transport system substrate-binding protein